MSIFQYKLLNCLHVHDGAIRSLAVFGNESNGFEVVTGCQSDSPNFRRWTIGINDEITESIGTSAVNHDHWVTALTSLPSDSSSPFYPKGCIISGCNDSKIRIFDSETNSLQCTLEGHSKGIISFSWVTTASGDKYLLSGSWDGTARVWDLATNTCVQELGPHENGVHVLGLSTSAIATVSTGESVNGRPANYRLRLWDLATGKETCPPIEDHEGSIRSISSVPGIGGFATTANDGSMIIRTIEGAPIGSMYHPLQEDGSPAFIMDCCALDGPSGMETVSCGEDGSCMVWSGTDLQQSIPHPTTVWCLLPVPGSGGDFITGANDGVLRYFSKNPDKTSGERTEQLTREFEAEVMAAVIKKKRGPSSEDLAKAPKWEARGSVSGKKEGDVSVFNKDGSMIAAQWTSGSWVVIGEVTGTGDGGEVNGEHYDHVMPVEIETPNGVASLQLGHNNGENPFLAAQRFIDQNNLEQSYQSQIADWITARSGQEAPTLGMEVSNSGSSGASSSGSEGASAAPSGPTFAFKLITFTAFDDVPANKEKLFAKIVEFNASASPCMTEGDLSGVSACLSTLCATSHYHSTSIPEGQVNMVMKMVNWETDKLFPFFDLLRLIAVHPHGASTLSRSVHTQTVVHKALAVLQDPTSPSFATPLTAIRFLANMFKIDELRQALLSDALLDSVIISLKAYSTHANKHVRIAVASVLMNVSVLSKSPSFVLLQPSSSLSGALSQNLQVDSLVELLQITKQLACAERDTAEVVVRAVKATGTFYANCGQPDIHRLVTSQKVGWTAEVCVSIRSSWNGGQSGGPYLIQCVEALHATLGAGAGC